MSALFVCLCVHILHFIFRGTTIRNDIYVKGGTVFRFLCWWRGGRLCAMASILAKMFTFSLHLKCGESATWHRIRTTTGALEFALWQLSQIHPLILRGLHTTQITDTAAAATIAAVTAVAAAAAIEEKAEMENLELWTNDPTGCATSILRILATRHPKRLTSATHE